ncbi:MAG: hypothetical protein LBR22_01870 [Desulfovibrio sp.]|nr:hypothetical protein [Desulfovibrio sp.]
MEQEETGKDGTAANVDAPTSSAAKAGRDAAGTPYVFGCAPRARTVRVHHSVDADGHASAAIVPHRHPDAIFVGMAYQPFKAADFLGAVPGMRRRVFVDRSFAPEILRAVARRAEARIVRCDHNVSSIRSRDADVAATGPIPGLVLRLSRDGTEAGCILAWREFMGGEGGGKDDGGRDGRRDGDFPLIPRAVRLVSLYGTWRKSDPDWKDGSMLVAQGASMRSACRRTQSSGTMLAVGLHGPDAGTCRHRSINEWAVTVS